MTINNLHRTEKFVCWGRHGKFVFGYNNQLDLNPAMPAKSRQHSNLSNSCFES